MKTVALVVFPLLFVFPVLVHADNKDKKDDPKGVLVIEVDAADLAKEFQNDPEAAKKKYDPTGPKGGAGGAVVKLSGVVDSATDKDITLKGAGKVAVVIRAKKVTGTT